MKKFTVLALLIFSLVACKDKQPEASNTEEVVEAKKTPKTYAELSVAQGGSWADGPRGHQEYAAGTSFKNVSSVEIPEQHTDHTWYLRYEGPGWENSQVGYRLYLDWRNAIDIFGKKVDSMVLPYVGQDGFDSYHEAANWGQDILKAGKSLGIGGYGRMVADSVAHFRTVKSTKATITNAEDHSTVEINYQGWTTGDESIDLKTQLSIYPEDRYTKAELNASKDIAGICTGIVKFKDVPLVKKEGSNWAYMATYGAQTLVSDTDNLGMAIFYKLADLDEQKEGVNDHLIIFKPTTQTLSYYFLGAWEQELNGLSTESAFFQDLDKKLAELDRSNSL